MSNFNISKFENQDKLKKFLNDSSFHSEKQSEFATFQKPDYDK